MLHNGRRLWEGEHRQRPRARVSHGAVFGCGAASVFVSPSCSLRCPPCDGDPRQRGAWRARIAVHSANASMHASVRRCVRVCPLGLLGIVIGSHSPSRQSGSHAPPGALDATAVPSSCAVPLRQRAQSRAGGWEARRARRTEAQRAGTLGGSSEGTACLIHRAS